MCLCEPCTRPMPEEASEPPELELKTAVSCHVGARNQTWILLKNSQCSQPLSHFTNSEKL